MNRKDGLGRLMELVNQVPDRLPGRQDDLIRIYDKLKTMKLSEAIHYCETIVISPEPGDRT